MSSSKHQKPLGQRWVDRFSIAAEISNVGIVIEVVSKWIPPILTVFGGLFSYIVFITDPLIYFFRSLVRLTRIIGRNLFGIQFEEEKHGAHPHITLANVASLCCFGIAIPLFFGLIISSPIAITIAWACALVGLAITAHFDYAYQASKAWDKYYSLNENQYSLPDEVEKAHDEYKTARNAKWLFIALLVGLAVLLLCGSATAFAPPFLAPILTGAAQAASAFLVFIALGRYINSKCTNNKPESKVFIMTTLPKPSIRKKYKGHYIYAADHKLYHYIQDTEHLMSLSPKQYTALISSNKLSKIKKYKKITTTEALKQDTIGTSLLSSGQCYFVNSSGAVEKLMLKEITAKKAAALIASGKPCYYEADHKIISASTVGGLDQNKMYLTAPEELGTEDIFTKINTSESMTISNLATSTGAIANQLEIDLGITPVEVNTENSNSKTTSIDTKTPGSSNNATHNRPTLNPP